MLRNYLKITARNLLRHKVFTFINVTGLAVGMTREFLIIAVAAGLVSVPVAWMVMNKWLETFAYRIELGFTPFFVSLAVVALLGLVTVSYHSIRAATTNPIESLRHE